tara:strand:+ start:4685 stop:4831 length:147 start_codon:yes stop_codon:yes gene_type:complete
LEEGREPALEVAKEEAAPTKGSQKSGPPVKFLLHFALCVNCYGGRAEI